MFPCAPLGGIGGGHGTKASLPGSKVVKIVSPLRRDPSWSGGGEKKALEVGHVIAVCTVTERVVIKRYR